MRPDAWLVCFAVGVACAKAFDADCLDGNCDRTQRKLTNDDDEIGPGRIDAKVYNTTPKITQSNDKSEAEESHTNKSEINAESKPKARLLNLNLDEGHFFANTRHNQSRSDKKLSTDLSDINLDDDEDELKIEAGAVERTTEKFISLQGPFHPMIIGDRSPDVGMCIENGVRYKVGDQMSRGCEEICVCTPHSKFDCMARCRHPYIRRGRRLDDPLCFESPVDDCCSIVACATDVKPTTVNSQGVELCRSGNETHAVGATWNIGCEQVCTCERNSKVTCIPRCPKLILSDKCINVPDPNDSCCQMQVCDVSQDVHEEPSENYTVVAPTEKPHPATNDEKATPQTTMRPLVLAEPITAVKVLQNNSVQVTLIHSNNTEDPIHLQISRDDGRTYEDVQFVNANLIKNLEGGKDYIIKTKETGTKFNFTIINKDVALLETKNVSSGIGCHQDGKFYAVGEEFHIGCTELCECTGSETRECAPLNCPSHVGLELVSRGCVRWAPTPTPQPPDCCPRSARCLSDGTCHYNGHAIPNWSEVPISLTGCEQRCFCENGDLDCQEVCTALPAVPPQTLRCPPGQHPAHVNISDDDCCKHWGCLKNAGNTFYSESTHPTSTPFQNYVTSYENREQTTSIFVTLATPSDSIEFQGPFNIVPIPKNMKSPKFNTAPPYDNSKYTLNEHKKLKLETNTPVNNKKYLNFNNNSFNPMTGKPTKPLMANKQINLLNDAFRTKLSNPKNEEITFFSSNHGQNIESDQNINVPFTELYTTEETFVSNSNNPRVDLPIFNTKALPNTASKGALYNNNSGKHIKIVNVKDLKRNKQNFENTVKIESKDELPSNQALLDPSYDHKFKLNPGSTFNFKHILNQAHVESEVNAAEQFHSSAGSPSTDAPPPSNKLPLPEFLPTIQPEIHFPRDDIDYDQNNIHSRPVNSVAQEPIVPPILQAIPAYVEENKKLTMISLLADSPTSVKMLFGLPPVLVGLRGSVDLRYTDKDDNDISHWYSQVFAPADEVLTTSRLEFRLTGLKPSTMYKLKGKLFLHNFPVEPESDVFSVRTLDLPSLEEKRRDIDSRLSVVEVNDTAARLTWRHFHDDELPFIDAIQVRYRPVGQPVYTMTELLHHSRSSVELHELRPGSRYEAALVLVPPPRATTELWDPATVEFNTSPHVDPYNWSVVIETKTVGSRAAELTWRGIPEPAERWVRIYRAAHACGSGRAKEHDAFRLATRDQMPTMTISGLEPDSRCRVWLELFLANGKVKTSNVLEVNTKSEDTEHPIDNTIEASSAAGRDGRTTRGDYYGALVVVGVVAALGALASLLLLLVVVRRHRPHSVPITPVPTAPRDSSLPPYDNPAYKLELQQETMDL